MAPAENISAGGFKSVVDLNLVGSWNVIKCVFDLSMKANGGSIVNVLVAMKNGFPLMCHSGAARAGVENLSKSLAREWGCFGIRVNSVCPGTIIGNGILQYPPGVLPMALSKIPGRTALGRLGLEAEVAAAVVFLSSRAAAYITGTSLPVDGGVTLQTSFAPEKATAKVFETYSGFAKVDNLFTDDKVPDILKNQAKRLLPLAKL